MLILGKLQNFNDIIKKNIQLAVQNNKVVPVLIYGGQYFNVYENEEVPNKNTENKLEEIIEEIICLRDRQEGFLITRGVNDSLRVSLVYFENGRLKVWVPKITDLFDTIKNSSSLYGKDQFPIVKEISERLAVSTDFKVEDIVNKYAWGNVNILSKEEILVNSMPLFGNPKDLKPAYVIHALLKHIMISEDIRYSRHTQAGRYLIQLAFYDYIINNESKETIIKKYKLPQG
ncbi:hypothetical protein [Paenibacillus sp. DMB5]|uniref:hypothetical protein n=1 Tax=Paenibacillus sp. DMB5 TaxID=1780103 RepID=UPI00076BC4EE|nr:hypothetical protein [Paenibacillus sp. DMB5]KUP21138.1 hypothetical protein AWJ19_08005 [Paenibacillus sp. DMB5]